MGRVVRRVPLDFKWPLNMTWKGYVCPYRGIDCTSCGGRGYNAATCAIEEDWYDSNRTGRRWDADITQDEVQALVDKHRLNDFTHEYVQGEGWVAKDPPYVPTAEEVNRWSENSRRPGNGFGHDSINRWICVETRAKRLGVWGLCEFCGGEGTIWFNDEIKQKADNWYDNERYHPPSGKAYQMWETTSEGSPISPPMATPQELANWLEENEASAFGGSGQTAEEWLNWIAPSRVPIFSKMLDEGVLKYQDDKPIYVGSHPNVENAWKYCQSLDEGWFSHGNGSLETLAEAYDVCADAAEEAGDTPTMNGAKALAEWVREQE